MWCIVCGVVYVGQAHVRQSMCDCACPCAHVCRHDCECVHASAYVRENVCLIFFIFNLV